MTTPPTTQELVDAALDYATRKWYIIPLHGVTQGHCSCGNPQCDAPGKHPRIADWTNTASTDPAQIRQWWTQWLYANVGILTGERSGLAVLDVDPRNGGDLALEDLAYSYGPLPETPVVISGGKGPHHYFRLDGPLGKFDPGPGLNLQANGALVVAPPSLHSSGNSYEWEASSHPDDVPLAPLPDWLTAMGAARDTTPMAGVDLPDVLPVIHLQDLKVSHRIKYLIQTGEDPDDSTRYCHPNGTPDRSRALFAVLQALLSAGYDDATLASVVMDQRYGISSKVLSQKNARNPRYWDQTKAWVAKEIARAKAKQPPPLTVSGQAPQSTPQGSSPWEKAVPIGDFLQQQDDARSALARDLVVPGAITIVAAPRGTGKSLTALALSVALASGGVFRAEVLPPTSVLLVDRDNPPAIVRTRLRRLGATAGHTLDVMTRDEAPPLKDKAAWAAFPVDKYAVVLIDSLGAATEGISEKEGKLTQEFLATLKDLAHRGPAILALDNTNKAATSYRGRGEKADAVDILYEARDITGWTPASGDAWWESLPEYGDHTWQSRATRRKGQAVLRIAFVPSKYRLGIQPDPFALEIDTTTMPWSLRDMTGLLAQTGTDAAHQLRQQTRHKLAQAATALKAHLAQRAPAHPLKKTEAIAFLRGQGLTRQQARNLLEDAYNADVYPQAGYWHLRPDPTQKGPPICVYLAGSYHSGKEQTPSDTPSNDAASEQLILAVGQPGGGQDVDPLIPKNGADYPMPDLGRGSTGQRQRSTPINGSVSADENAGSIFAAPPQHGRGPVGSVGRERDRREDTSAPAPPVNSMAHGECPRCGADDMTLVQRHGPRACVGCSTLSDTELARMRAALSVSPLAPAVPHAAPPPANGPPPPQERLHQPQAAREVFDI